MTSERRRGAGKNRFEAIYPLTPAQEGMLYHTVAAPGSGVYVEQLAFRARRGFRPDLFAQAIEAAIVRHPILRTGFSWEKRETPIQAVLRKGRLPVAEDDWSDLDTATVEQRFEDLMAADRQRGFDLAKPPALRLRWLNLGDDGFLGIFSYHHILLDAWSLARLFGEILADYRGRLQGVALPFETPPAFGDFVRWLKDRDPGAGEQFWRHHLAGLDGPTLLAQDTERGEAALGMVTQGDLRRTLDPEVSQALDTLASQHGLTLAVMAQAAWALVLGAFTGRDDVVFGAAVAGRPPELRGAEAMVGLFINTVVTRSQLPATATLVPWLEGWQRSQAERSDHEHVPLAEVQRWAGVPRDRSLFDSLVVFENAPVDRLAAGAGQGRDGDGGDGGVALDGLDYRPQTHYPLTLLVVPEQPMTMRLLFLQPAISPDLAETLLDALAAVLGRMAAQPKATLDTLMAGLGLDRDGLETRLAEHPAVVRADLVPPRWGRPKPSLQLEVSEDSVDSATVAERLPTLPGLSSLEPVGWAPAPDREIAALAWCLAELTGEERPRFEVEQTRLPSGDGEATRHWVTLTPQVDPASPKALLRSVRRALVTSRALALTPDRAEGNSETGLPRLQPLADSVTVTWGDLAEDPNLVGGSDGSTIPARRWSAALARRCHQLTTLDQTVTHPLDDGHALDAAEHHQRVVAWNDTGQLTEHLDNPVAAFERQAADTPDAVAVVLGNDFLTYGALDAWSNRVARQLVTLGVGPEMAVGLCFERSFEMVVGFLAVLKAGGVHVPFDPAYPRERLDLMAEDAAIAVLLGVEATRDRMPGLGEVPVLLLDDPAAVADEDPTPLASRAVADNLGYVIYTSGSTGRPKGVALSRGVMTNLVRWQLDLTPLPVGGRTLQFTSFSFDVSVLEMLAPLASAGTLVLLDEAHRRDFGAIVDTLVTQRVERLILPFTALEHLAEHLEGRPVEGLALRHVISTGEALQITPPIVELFRRLPTTQLFNGYGPSETHFITDHALALGQPSSWPTLPPIGRPIRNSTIVCVDPGLRPVPLGVPGEMVLGGLPVARGYLGRPAATAERFVPDPWGGPGARLYRSGDLARHRDDGSLDYLGRLDHQVKVRGHRVELGEIEVALRRLPSVLEAAVVARPGALPGDQRLEAFIVPPSGSEVDGSGLAEALRSTLPEPLIPSLFHRLDALPQTATGKLDRRRLMTLELASERDGAGGGDSGHLTRDLLARLWCRLLSVPRVEADADFFALGGHSLLATRLVSQVRRVFDVELPLATVFETPGLDQQAAAIDRARQAGATATPPMERAPRDQPLPLSFAQQRLWLHERLENVGWAYNIPAALALDGPLDLAALGAALDAVEARHEMLRTTFEEREGNPIQVIGAGNRGPLPEVDLQGLDPARAEAECRRWVAQLSRQVFDLERGPLWRAVLLRQAPERHALSLCFHHIILDLWSVGVLVSDVSELYRAAVAGRPPALAAPALQYADFAAWQRRWLEGPVLDAQLATWRQRLQGAPDEIALPLTRPEALAGHDTRGGDHAIFLPGPLRQRLEDLARDRGATLFMVLLAAFEVLIHRHTGETDLVVGTDFANRVREETESMVGFFINVLPLRTDLSGAPTFERLIERVRRTALEAHANQDVPFDALVKELGSARQSRSPLVRVLFVVQNTPRETLDLGGIAVRDLDVGTGTSKFDLAVFVDRDGEGLSCRFGYRHAVYDVASVRQLASRYLELLARLAEHPKHRIDTFEISTRNELQEQAMESQKKASDSKRRFSKFQRRRPKAVSLETESLVDSSYLPGAPFPRVLTPRLPDVDLAEWASGNRETLDRELDQHGAILLRGFGIESVPAFERFAANACDRLFGDYGDLPKEDAGKKVYKSTPYPEDKMILFHNESAHMDRWPLRQFFLCVHPAEEGGETPILDCRRIYEALDPEIRDAFESKGLLYVRNFIEGIDVSWRDFFRTEDKAVAEAKCREAGMTWEWLDNGLRTEQRCPAVALHPRTQERVFFNQIQLHHIACLDTEVRDSMRQIYSERELPRHVFFGDGTPIPDAVMQTIGTLYDDMAVSFPWQQGDILMVDNMLIAHARNPFKGANRRIAVVMGDMFEQSALAPIH